MKIRHLIFCCLLAFIIGVLTEFLCCVYRVKNEPKPTIQKDTLVVRDTLEVEIPVPVNCVVIDTILVAIRDTVTINDTVYVELPREVVTYSEDEYYAVISGYEPKLEKIKVYPKTVYIRDTQGYTEYKGQSRFGLSVSAGPGLLVDLQGNPHFGGGIVAGIGWRF